MEEQDVSAMFRRFRAAGELPYGNLWRAGLGDAAPGDAGAGRAQVTGRAPAGRRAWRSICSAAV
ncbi:hypothetical protein MJ560_23020 [Klebsiella pneumoniae]|nr:hypothetical protein MJ560_23020 [Klebsiella pneumoniae]